MVFTPEQRVELTKAFDAGLQTTGKSVASEITQLSEKLSLSADAIKRFILYRRAVKRGVRRDRRKRVYMKGPTAFNAFCASNGKGHDIKNWSEMWRRLSPEEKCQYRNEALLRKGSGIVHNDLECANIIRSCVKIIGKQVENLSNLGCDVVCMVVNREKDVMCKTCTVVGDQWLDKTESIQKFRDFVVHCQSDNAVNVKADIVTGGKIDTVSAKTELRNLQLEVQKMLNAKYSAAVRMEKSMPYKAVSEGRVLVHGLPASCVPIKIPSHYSKASLKLMLAAKDDIYVEIPAPINSVAENHGSDHTNVRSTEQHSTAVGMLDQATINTVMAVLRALPAVTMPPLQNSMSNDLSLDVSVGTDSSVSSLPQPQQNKGVRPLRKRKAVDNLALVSGNEESVGTSSPTDTCSGMDERPNKKKRTSKAKFCDNDDTPCCVCSRRYNQPPVDEWVVCQKCKKWHHVKCGPPNRNGICFTC